MKVLLIFAIFFAIGFCIVWFLVRENYTSSSIGFARDFAFYVAPVMAGVFMGVGSIVSREVVNGKNKR